MISFFCSHCVLFTDDSDVLFAQHVLLSPQLTADSYADGGNFFSNGRLFVQYFQMDNRMKRSRKLKGIQLEKHCDKEYNCKFCCLFYDQMNFQLSVVCCVLVTIVSYLYFVIQQ